MKLKINLKSAVIVFLLSAVMMFCFAGCKNESNISEKTNEIKQEISDAKPYFNVEISNIKNQKIDFTVMLSDRITDNSKVSEIGNEIQKAIDSYNTSDKHIETMRVKKLSHSKVKVFFDLGTADYKAVVSITEALKNIQGISSVTISESEEE